ncbi:MAG: nucleotidyltransferase family protein [bacterium]
MSKKEILNILSRSKSTLHKKYRIRELGLFGSYVRNENSTESDVDILVEFDEVPDLLTFVEIEAYLEKILNAKVDLVRKKALRPELREFILNEVHYA